VPEGDSLQKSYLSRSKSDNQAAAFHLGATTRCPQRCLPLAQSARINAQRLKLASLVLSNRTILTLSCRHPLWHSLVFSAAERESAYVIDGLMHNEVVKSDIHSTDPFGYTEAIFTASHLTGFSAL
jgi:hypothetical protein